MERRMLDAAASGSVMNLDPDQVRALIKETAESARFTDTLARRDEHSRTRNVSQVEASNSQLAEEMKELREMMRMMMVAQGNGAKPCEQCNMTTHRTDECPSFQMENHANVNAVGGFQQPNQAPKYGLAENGYSWKQGGFPNQQNQQQHGNAPQERLWEVALNQLGQQLNNQIGALSKKMERHAESTSKQIAQLNADMTELKAETGKLPSQTVPNPKCGVNAITTRTGKLLNDQTDGEGNSGNSSKDHADPPQLPTRTYEGITEITERTACIEKKGSAYLEKSDSTPADSSPPLPFPNQLKKPKKSTELDPELLELFSKVELTIPLIDAIQQVPKYAKFIKELCTTRRGVVKAEQKPPKKQSMAANIPKDINPKYRDRGMFIIPCMIGLSCRENNCMLDIGSAINVMPDSIYRTMQIGPLRSTDSVVQLANKSCARPEGIITDILVRVGELVFLVDFYVLQDDIKESADDSRIILGRPFMVTARTKTDS